MLIFFVEQWNYRKHAQHWRLSGWSDQQHWALRAGMIPKSDFYLPMIAV
jgi:hypothetical protein